MFKSLVICLTFGIDVWLGIIKIEVLGIEISLIKILFISDTKNLIF